MAHAESGGEQREKFFIRLREIDYSDAGASEADVFVLVGDDIRIDAELFAYEGFKDAVACAVEDSHFLG